MHHFVRNNRTAAVLRLCAVVMLAVAVAPALRAQPVVPAANLVVYRRQQGFNATAYTWTQLQDGAVVQTFSSTGITVPAGKHLVVTGIRYWFFGTSGADVFLGTGGNVADVYQRLIRVAPAGSTTTLEGFEQLTNGISFPSGSKVNIRVNKTVASTSDTVTWWYLYGYLEAN